jgi:hypothetical protein
VVRYLVDRGEPPRERFFPTLARAAEFAERITSDGTTAHPHRAAIVRRTRSDDRGAWLDDQGFGPVEIGRGRCTEGPGDPA